MLNLFPSFSHFPAAFLTPWSKILADWVAVLTVPSFGEGHKQNDHYQWDQLKREPISMMASTQLMY